MDEKEIYKKINLIIEKEEKLVAEILKEQMKYNKTFVTTITSIITLEVAQKIIQYFSFQERDTLFHEVLKLPNLNEEQINSIFLEFLTYVYEKIANEKVIDLTIEQLIQRVVQHPSVRLRWLFNN